MRNMCGCAKNSPPIDAGSPLLYGGYIENQTLRSRLLLRVTPVFKQNNGKARATSNGGSGALTGLPGLAEGHESPLLFIPERQPDGGEAALDCEMHNPL